MRCGFWVTYREVIMQVLQGVSKERYDFDHNWTLHFARKLPAAARCLTQYRVGFAYTAQRNSHSKYRVNDLEFKAYSLCSIPTLWSNENISNPYRIIQKYIRFSINFGGFFVNVSNQLQSNSSLLLLDIL